MDSQELQKLEGKNWVATMMLCWSLGALGAHRFYTGKKNSAWAMLVLTLLGCSAPISCLWAMLDGIAIALGQFTHADGSPLYERKAWLGYVYLGIIALAFISSLIYGAVFLAFGATLLPGLTKAM